MPAPDQPKSESAVPRPAANASPLPSGTVGIARTVPKPSIPDHELLSLIGEGAGGQVWLGRNCLGTYRAVKILKLSSVRDRRVLQRELEGLTKFEPISRQHEGLVDILQIGSDEAQDIFYYVMELADDVKTGPMIDPERYVPRTLAHEIGRHQRLPISECIRLAAALASALGYLHRQGLIHRDVKPSNIIFVNGGPKLADIGLVTQMAQDKSYVGTDGFIPPEGPGTARADIYSLGKVLYEISTGLDRNRYPELPEDLGDMAEDRDLVRFTKIVLQACRRRPSQRFRTAEQLMSAILRFEFDSGAVRKERKFQAGAKVVGLIGALVSAGVVIALVRQLIRLLNAGG